ncbi:MAG: M13 family metallopeptidase, partial [Lachnospiraceae bacterium]|nr:M13 family metallopeptidase [Lachnospiraceae bacterium]
ILSKLNFKKEETEALLAAGWRMEKELAGIDSTLPESEQIRIMLSWDECVKAAGSFPLETILRSWGFNEKEHFYMDTGYAKKLGRIYTDGNLEDLKSMLVMQLVTASALYLDRETYDLTKELEKPRMFTMKEEPPRTEEYKNAGILFDEYIANSSVGPILDELYLRRYMKKKEARPLRRMVEDLKKHYEALFQEEEWLSEEGRAQCIEKLSAMKTHVVYPDFDMVDYSSLKLIPRDKGGTFFKAVCDSQQCTAAHNAYLAGVVNDREKWDPYIISTTVTNAFYMPNTNGIYILAGLLEDPIYRPDMSREELLGGIGAVVGHEITHGFDANGSLYNKDGLKESWMSSEDTTAFSDRTMKVSSYYSTIHPFSGAGSYDGSKVSAEATADMGGLRLTLAIAEDDPDFDYETFFRQYAAIWRTQNDEDVETSLINADEHPLAYLRINVGLQQFPKFYETFGVKEGDGMYLEESKRIAVW